MNQTKIELWRNRGTLILQGGRTLLEDMRRSDMFRHASAMAYVTLFSLIPSLAVTFSLMSIFTSVFGETGGWMQKGRDFLLSNLAAGSGDRALEYIESFLQNLDLKKIGLTGFAGMLVTLIMLLKQIEEALNRIWLIHKPRSLWTRFLYFWLCLTLGTFLVGLLIGILSVSVMSKFEFLGGSHLSGISAIFTQALPPTLIFLAFFILYKVVPNTHVHWRPALAGAIPATFIFWQSARLYGWYTAKFTNYQAIYGALAAVPLFLLWLYIVWVIALLGAVISWRVQQGFNLKRDSDSDEVHLTPTERFRNAQIQQSIPLLVLIAIAERFKSATGHGLTISELNHDLNLPEYWIRDALTILEECGFIVCRGATEMDLNDSDGEFFPTFPPDSYTVVQVVEKLSASAQEWLKHWEHRWPGDLKRVAAHYGAIDLKSGSVSDLVTRLRSAPARP